MEYSFKKKPIRGVDLVKALIKIVLFCSLPRLGLSWWAIIGVIPALFFTGRPFKVALDLASDLKIWDMAMAIGGSFTMLEALETGLIHRQVHDEAKQGIAVIGVFAGAQLASGLSANLRSIYPF